MPSNQFRSGDVVCPFFKGRGLLDISCEGPFDGVVLTRLVFRRKASIDFHFDKYCCSKSYKYCEVYRMVLEHKYPEDSRPGL